VISRIGFIHDATYYYVRDNSHSITRSYSINHIESYLFIVKQILYTDNLYTWLVNTHNEMCSDFIFYAMRQLSMLNIDKEQKKDYFYKIKTTVMDERYIHFLSNSDRFRIRITNYCIRYCNTRINFLILKLMRLYLSIELFLKRKPLV
jgi:hypothetical protein